MATLLGKEGLLTKEVRLMMMTISRTRTKKTFGFGNVNVARNTRVIEKGMRQSWMRFLVSFLGGCIFLVFEANEQIMHLHF